eukprot:SAG31_NODE_8035_length_1536_cov_1.192763_1_plen_113_part_10
MQFLFKTGFEGSSSRQTAAQQQKGGVHASRRDNLASTSLGFRRRQQWFRILEDSQESSEHASVSESLVVASPTILLEFLKRGALDTHKIDMVVFIDVHKIVAHEAIKNNAIEC